MQWPLGYGCGGQLPSGNVGSNSNGLFWMQLQRFELLNRRQEKSRDNRKPASTSRPYSGGGGVGAVLQNLAKGGPVGDMPLGS
jgi:hypothetical protein